MDVVSPTYEITIPVEGGHEEAVAIAIAFEDWYAAHRGSVRYTLGAKDGQQFGDRAPRLGAIALRQIDPIVRGLGFAHRPFRRLLSRGAIA